MMMGVSAIRVLLENLVDYAGLFPPAALPMREAVENYQRYRESAEAWMLSRFIVPVSRLDEFEACAPNPETWTLSVLGSGNLEADIERIACARGRIDTIELKAANEEQIESAMRKMPRGLTAYFEVRDVSLIPMIASSGARAKIRTGGVTPEAIPAPVSVAAFLRACTESNTPFKATAGLHHPLRCLRPLTYSADGPSGWMFGFLNIFLAAAFARSNFAIDHLLVEESAEAIAVAEDSVRWRGCTVMADQIAAARQFAIAFGSCSFEEPVADLRALHLL